MRTKNKVIHSWLLCILLLFFASAKAQQTPSIEYTFQAALNSNEQPADFEQISFKTQDNLNLGFFKGKVWIKLDISNHDVFESYMVMTNDLIHRNYRFYKRDNVKNKLIPVVHVEDLSKADHRTNNYPKPNFKIDLNPLEKATFYISVVSDGRILDATPQLLTLDAYGAVINRNTVFNIVFFAALGMIFLINIFLWSILKNKIYPFYSLYILSSCLFYLSVEGYFYGIGFTHIAIDHFIIISIRIWIISAAMFSARFLELKSTNPKFTNVVKWMLIFIIGGATFYQFVFFNSSVSHLHLIENIFGFIWLIISVIAVLLSVKKRKLQAKYYLIAFSFLLIFIALGLIDSHTTFLPGDPLFYFKIGIVVEFIGFTYFIALNIKRNLNKAIVLESQLNQNKQVFEAQLNSLKASPKIEKTDFLNIFKLLETQLSKADEWPAFKARFKELNPNYLTNLKKAHPNLSKAEIRLLILIRIGFTQKEIAHILNIAPDSVKKAKNRVRKKMELESTTKLSTYLSQFN